MVVQMKTAAARPTKACPSVAVGQLLWHLLLVEQVQQLVLQRQVAVEAGLQAADPQHHEVGLQGMPISGRRDRTPHRALITPFAHTLRGPQQEGQLIQGERLGVEAAAALAVADGRRQVYRLNSFPLPDRRQIEPFGVGREWLFQGRRLHARVLIGPGEVDLLADRVLEKLPASVQLAFGHNNNSNMGQEAQLFVSMIPGHACNTSSPRTPAGCRLFHPSIGKEQNH